MPADEAMSGAAAVPGADGGLRAVEARIERLIAELSEPPPVRARAEELVALLMRLYGDGLGRIARLLPADELARLAEDDLVGSLLILHDLHPRSVRERIGDALDGVRPYLGAHADGLRLVEAGEDGVARIRLGGAAARGGCGASARTARAVIEDAVRAAAPEITEVVFEAPAPEPVLVRLTPRRGPS